ncbi:DNA adenine methylase, partial [Bacteroides heparinolyticus]
SGMIRYNARGEFNVPFGRYQHLNTNSVTLSHSKLLQRADILNTDYSEVFKMCESDDFVFLDPPYDCVFSDYGNEEYKDGFNDENHIRLANDFVNLPCKTLMVIGKTPLTEQLYRGYIIDEYEKKYAVNIRNRFKAAAKHIVVANYRKSWDDIRVYSTVCDTYREPEITQLRLFEASQPYGTNR